MRTAGQPCGVLTVQPRDGVRRVRRLDDLEQVRLARVGQQDLGVGAGRQRVERPAGDAEHGALVLGHVQRLGQRGAELPTAALADQLVLTDLDLAALCGRGSGAAAGRRRRQDGATDEEVQPGHAASPWRAASDSSKQPNVTSRTARTSMRITGHAVLIGSKRRRGCRRSVITARPSTAMSLR